MSSDAEEATRLARDALKSASITDQGIREWEEVLRSEYEDEFGQPSEEKEADFARLAPIEVVREQVHDALRSAELENASDVLVEVHGTIDCG